MKARCRTGTDLVVEEQAAVGAHWGNAGAGGQHHDVGLRILWQQHLCTCRSRNHDIIAHAEITDVVGADAAVNLVVRETGASLVGLVLTHLTVDMLAVQLNHALDAKRHCLRGLVVSDGGRGDRVEADAGRRFALLVRPRCNDTDGLTLDVGHLAIMVEGHMGGLPVGVTGVFRQGLRMLLVWHHLCRVRRLWGEEVPGDLLAVNDLDALPQLRDLGRCWQICITS